MPSCVSLENFSDLSHIQIIKKAGGQAGRLGFILDKEIGVNQPKRLEKAKILVADASRDKDKTNIFGACVKVGTSSKLADLEKAGEKMNIKVEKIKAHGINSFINRRPTEIRFQCGPGGDGKHRWKESARAMIMSCYQETEKRQNPSMTAHYNSNCTQIKSSLPAATPCAFSLCPSSSPAAETPCNISSATPVALVTLLAGPKNECVPDD
ncbi:putative T-complex protein 1 subunit eta [Colletotrichum spaethianum]|uniref:T-complex protein 1 subunit eta n=1 Tax=Colletotrichum spaethianum TaxID=700344 RepID=A0AA37UL36_9PEZI|nr:putative T-complex protein 1 subunit eta [Colletotrichum spaethianum]GKT51061.1 putative T-complex protein 1 subunit eta [Colletotrichum spaethianum]